MSISRLPSGRYRVQIWDAKQNKSVSASSILPELPTSFRTKNEAKDARARAKAALRTRKQGNDITVAEFAARWVRDKLFARPKVSTNVQNEANIRGFVQMHGHLLLREVDDAVVSQWLAGGERNWTVPSLRAMFNDAASAKAGRLIDRNPFAGLGISRGKGNKGKNPPAEDMVWKLIAHAEKISGPYFAAWLQVAAFTGMRPGELDALRWERVDFKEGVIHVAEQWSAPSKNFTLPKNGQQRYAPLTTPARDALLQLPQEGTFCFLNLRNEHWTPSSRAYHWKATRAAAGWDGSLYLATRHFAGWYMTNVLGLAAEDVAIALGHTDGGYLVRNLYGHIDHGLALRRVSDAYAAQVRPLRVIDERNSA